MAHLQNAQRRLGRVAASSKRERWGLILAGRDGTRLRPHRTRVLATLARIGIHPEWSEPAAAKLA